MNISPTVSAIALFQDCTYLGHDEHTKREVQRVCSQQGYIAIIDYAPEFGWVFHSLQYPKHDQVWKKTIAAQFEQKRLAEGGFYSEHEMESVLCQLLDGATLPYQRQVWCPTGRIDLVTITSIVELKLSLSRDELFRSIGQVLTYRAAYDMTRKAVIVGLRIEDNAESIAEFARKLGVSVVIWDGESADVINML